MKATEVFGIVVRTVGLVLVLITLAMILPGILSLAMGGTGQLIAVAVISVPGLIVGLWLLRGAPSIVSYAYPDEDGDG